MAFSIAPGCYTGEIAVEDPAASTGPETANVSLDGGLDDHAEGETDDSPDVFPRQAAVLIRVRNAEDDPIPFASVRIAGEDHRTDHTGYLLFPTAAGRFVATAEVPGHTPATIAVNVPAGARLTATAHLLPLGETIPLRSDEPADIVRDGVRLVLPANAVEDPDRPGEPLPPGTDLALTIVPLDPVTRTTTAPGPLVGLGPGGERVPLESVFMAEISLWRGSRRLQLLKPAHLELPVPTGHPTALPATVPAWWFDHEHGAWRQEGEGQLVERIVDGQVRRVWSADIAHLTWWNADVPLDERNCIDVTILDENAGPIAFKPVTAKGLTYEGHDTQYTDIDGHACLEMKKGAAQKALVFVGELGDENDPDPPVDPPSFEVVGSDVASWCGGPEPCIPVKFAWDPGVPACVDGATLPCGDWPYYDGPPNTEGVGICQGHKIICDQGQWSNCLNQQLPMEEICDDGGGQFNKPDDDPDNDLDNDCDGFVDESGGGCECQAPDPGADNEDTNAPLMPGECYSGPPSTRNIGGCMAGTWDCDLMGHWTCDGEVTPGNGCTGEGAPDLMKLEAVGVAVHGVNGNFVEDIAIAPGFNGKIFAAVRTEGPVHLDAQPQIPVTGTEAFTIGTDNNLGAPQFAQLGVEHIPEQDYLDFVGATYYQNSLVVAAMCSGPVVIGPDMLICDDRDLIVATLDSGTLAPIQTNHVAVPTSWSFSGIRNTPGQLFFLGIDRAAPQDEILLYEDSNPNPIVFFKAATIKGARLAVGDGNRLIVGATVTGLATVCGADHVSAKQDAFVAELDTSGNCIGPAVWFHGQGEQILGGVAGVPGTEDIVVALRSSGPELLQDGAPQLLPQSQQQLLVARLGVETWRSVFPASENNEPEGNPLGDVHIAADGQRVFVAGSITGSMTCRTADDVAHTTGGIFLAQLDPAGVCKVARALPLPLAARSYARALALHGDGKPVIAGSYMGGSLSIGTWSASQADNMDGFLIKITEFNL